MAVTLALALAPSKAAAQCDSPEDLAAVAATRALVDTRCDCDSAVNHGLYVRCVARVANEEIGAGHLDRRCRKSIIKCAARSVCGKPAGLMPCCRTTRLGKLTCKVRLAEQCHAGLGGTACTAPNTKSCCDACIAGGCASPSAAFFSDPKRIR